MGGSDQDIAAAIKWAAGLPVPNTAVNKRPAHVINMSLGGYATENFCPSVYREAIAQARNAGTLVVVAAGNRLWVTPQNEDCADDHKMPGCAYRPVDIKYQTPANCPGVISVAASDKRGRLAPYSSYGAVSIMAPGGDTSVNESFTIFGKQYSLPLGVWSTLRDSNLEYWYDAYQGTSMAAPHVSGAIALALSKRKDWRNKPDLIDQKLRASLVTVQPGACPANKPCGPGQLDALRLVNQP
jgi:serine protease